MLYQVLADAVGDPDGVRILQWQQGVLLIAPEEQAEGVVPDDLFGDRQVRAEGGAERCEALGEGVEAELVASAGGELPKRLIERLFNLSISLSMFSISVCLFSLIERLMLATIERIDRLIERRWRERVALAIVAVAYDRAASTASRILTLV